MQLLEIKIPEFRYKWRRRGSKGDVRQLPGVFIIDTAGQIVFSHFSDNPADHPDAKTILAAL